MKLILALALTLSTTAVFADTVTLMCSMTPVPEANTAPFNAVYIIDTSKGTLNGIRARGNADFIVWKLGDDGEGFLDRNTGRTWWQYVDGTTTLNGQCVKAGPPLL